MGAGKDRAVVACSTNMTDTRVLALVGSLRADSLNRKIVEAIKAQAPAGIAIEIAEGLGNLPFYNEDIDGDAAPAAVVAFREQVAQADRLVIVTPEYNGSTPAVIANAIDWASRPFGAGAIKGKPVAVVGTAVGQYGGQWSHDDTRKSAGVAGADVIADIQVSHPYAWGTDPSADAEAIAKFVSALEKLAVYEGVA